MDAGTISQLVYLVFGVAVVIYGFVVYRALSGLRVANDRARAKLDGLLCEEKEDPGSAELRERISASIQTFNQNVTEYNTRIGGFPESIVAAVMGLKRRELFRAPDEVVSKRSEVVVK